MSSKIELAEAKATAIAEAETQPGDLHADPMDTHIKMEIDQDPYQLDDKDPYQLDGEFDDPPLDQHDVLFNLPLFMISWCGTIFQRQSPKSVNEYKVGSPKEG